MTTKTTQKADGDMTLLPEQKLFGGWQNISTEDLIAVCRALIKRADTPLIKPDELETLRVVAAELRQRCTPLRTSAEEILH